MLRVTFVLAAIGMLAFGSTTTLRSRFPLPKSRWEAQVAPIPTGKTVRVCDLVSDATGKHDVADEVQAVLDGAWQSFGALNNTLVETFDSHGDVEARVLDLGGMVVDFCGGTYLLSKGLHLPGSPIAGNLRLTNGLLQADPATFPASDFVLALDQVASTNKVDRYRYVFIDAMEMDAAHVGLGCLMVDQAEETLIHRLVCTGYVWRGLWSTGVGNELFVQRSWFFEMRNWSSCHDDSAKTGTAVHLDNNDHQLDGVVVACSKAGIVVNGSASTIRATHIYTESRLPARETACVRILSGVAIVRMQDVYMDGCPVVSEGAALLHLSDSMFLFGLGVASSDVHGSGAAVVLTPEQDNAPLPGMQIFNNHVNGRAFNGSFVVLNETAGVLEFNHSNSYDTIIADNAATPWEIQHGVAMPSTRFSRAFEMTALQQEFVFRFSSKELLLCGAARISYTFVPSNASSAFVPRAITDVQPPLLSTAAGRSIRASQACPAGAPRLTITVTAERPISGVFLWDIDQTLSSSAAPQSNAGWPSD